jgi:hypothetical protein
LCYLTLLSSAVSSCHFDAFVHVTPLVINVIIALMQWCFLRTRILLYMVAFVQVTLVLMSSLHFLCVTSNTRSLAGTEANWCEDAYLTGADAEAQMAAVLLQVQPAGCVWEFEGTDDGKGCIMTAAGVRASANTYNAAKALLPNGCSLVSVLGNRRGMPYNASIDI